MRTPNHFETSAGRIGPDTDVSAVAEKFPFLGSGAFRRVWKLDEQFVLKLDDSTNARHTCREEAEIWECSAESPDLCPVVASGDGWVVMRRADTDITKHDCGYVAGFEECDDCDAFEHLVYIVTGEFDDEEGNPIWHCDGKVDETCWASNHWDLDVWLPFLRRVINVHGFRDIHPGNVGELDGRLVLIDYTH